MLMPVVQTPKGRLFVNVKMGIPEMALIVLVRHLLLAYSKFSKFALNTYFFMIFVDINECSLNPCHVNASCVDNDGSFVCQCNTGYSGNGLNCSSKYIVCWYMQSFRQFVRATYLFQIL